MEPEMKVYGLACASEFLDDRIVYRSLIPVDPSLPGLAECAPDLDILQGRVPRKHELDYASVVAVQLRAARAQQAPGRPLKRLVFVGDTELLDGTAFINLCRVTGWPGRAFIGAETCEGASYELVERGPGVLYTANRWTALQDFDAYCRASGLPIDEDTAVVIDLDKTILGARGRNSAMIDWSRSRAMELTIASLLGADFEAARFYQVYDDFNQPRFHTFTSDNQDYLAYICLMVLAGMVTPDALEADILQRKLEDIQAFMAQMDTVAGRMMGSLKGVHAEVYASVRAGDPTPFKAYRRKEYETTVSVMGQQDAGLGVTELLDQEIVLTEEVRRMALAWRQRGALLFGLSDKPDEASIPTPDLAVQGFRPLHRTPTHAVGKTLLNTV
jgi:hypothetical protein